MKFNGETKRKSRFLLRVFENGGLIHNSAAMVGVCMVRDHKRWMAGDTVYRRAFEYAAAEGAQRWEQHLFNRLCDAVRNGDEESERWITERCGENTITTIKQGHYPKWK